MRLPIRTERLVLRALNEGDLDDHQRLYGDPEVVRHLYEQPLDREQSATHLATRISSELPDEAGWLNLAVEHEGSYVGEVGVCLVSRTHRQCEIGYVFLPSAGGRGLATEAASAMVGVAFAELDAHRVVGRIEARNARSARVLERLGMRWEAHLRENEFVKGRWDDEIVYAILEDEWTGRHAERFGPAPAT